MKYKLLLTGENNVVIDDLFLMMHKKYDMMTTSIRSQDVVKHLALFEPDVFIYCINMNSYKNYNSIYLLKERLAKKKIPLVLIGSEEECAEFEKVTFNAADSVLLKPLSAEAIENKLDLFLQRWEEEIKKAEEELNAEIEAEKNDKRKHVLVIDDDPMMLKVVNEKLNEQYDVATAISGKLALKFLEFKTTDIILLDYEMPGDNGAVVLSKLRSNPKTKNIPVVFLTGVSEREKILEVLSMEPQGYMLKPIDTEKLLGLIREILEK